MEQIRFPKIGFGPGHNTVSFISEDGKTHTWVRYDDNTYKWSVPGYVKRVYSSKYTNEGEPKIKYNTMYLPIDAELMKQVDALIDPNKKW